MKKLLLLLLLVSGTAFAYHSYHSWRLVGQDVDQYTNQTICTWECKIQYPAHYTVTKGHGYCPHPY